MTHRIAYLVSQYPDYAHTFILWEVSHPCGTGANGYLLCLKSEPDTRRYQQKHHLKH